jgi:hypothetical protein
MLSANKTGNAIISKIEDMRGRLNHLVQEKGLGSREVLMVSRELDSIIVGYLRDCGKDKAKNTERIVE